MKFETITIKNPKTGKNMSLYLKENNILDRIVCSCNGKHTKASDCNAFVFDEKQSLKELLLKKNKKKKRWLKEKLKEKN